MGLRARTPVLVRPARPDDYDAVCAITEQGDALHRERVPWLFQAPEVPSRSREDFTWACAAEDSRILLAVREGVVGVAFVGLRSAPALPVFVPQRWAVLESLVVDARCRRRGIGAALVEAAEAWASDQGAPWLELGVYAANDEARAFYEALGYRPLLTKLHRPLSGPSDVGRREAVRAPQPTAGSPLARATPLAPRLTSARLVLTAPTLADAAGSASMWADPVVTRHIGGTPSTAGAAWLRFLAYVGHWNLLGYGYFVLRERATGRFVGEAGFADYHREIEPPLGDVPEAGFALAPWAHGQGYATEALRTLLAWADAALPAPRTACLVAPENAASQRVVQKCGYTRVRETLYKGAPLVVYERPARRT